MRGAWRSQPSRTTGSAPRTRWRARCASTPADFQKKQKRCAEPGKPLSPSGSSTATISRQRCRRGTRRRWRRWRQLWRRQCRRQWHCPPHASEAARAVPLPGPRAVRRQTTRGAQRQRWRQSLRLRLRQRLRQGRERRMGRRRKRWRGKRRRSYCLSCRRRVSYCLSRWLHAIRSTGRRQRRTKACLVTRIGPSRTSTHSTSSRAT
mmetsp:Transcript_25805/g.65470  ORF Transcript_25805/g.65470 Transcript_25805/m.65470 type:complete len:206 (+) Transcript_25805:1213-1830(+)